MGGKIFISYKYSDSNVAILDNDIFTKSRDYITKLQEYIDDNDHINKGENDDEDLSDFKDSTIETNLKKKIFDSTLTIIAISPNMKESWKNEDDQWIPWEIAYSLKEITKDGRTSGTNAILSIVLPDSNNSYSYFIEDDYCPTCQCRLLKTDTLFGILKRNMFNIKNPEYTSCDSHITDSVVYSGYSSYIYAVKWCDFIKDVNKYIDIAYEINKNKECYNISKTVAL